MGSGQNVSRIAESDINALITYDANNILNELLTARSDFHKSKRKLYSDIVENGQLVSLTSLRGVGGTGELKDTYLRCLGLDIS